MIGTTVGNYRIVEKLGDGGMGAVYRAIDQMLDREVAIKVLRPELARNSALIERFRQEAIALARLNHPRIATLHGLDRHEASFLMIMEYVRGETLEAIVQRSGRIGWARAAELVAATLDALDHAHDKGVVHRDIKPANIMLSTNGAVKVMDFGIARLIGKSRQTQIGHAVGTPMYMAPEQLRGEEVDGRTDLYACGAVLFELVTGRMAFEADSDYALMMKQLNDPPPAASSLVLEIPSVIDEIIMRAMAKRREDRFPNAMAFRDALELAIGAVAPWRVRTPVPPEAHPASPPRSLAQGSTPPRAVPASSTPPGAISPSAASLDDTVQETAEHSLTPLRAVAETRLAPSSDMPNEIANGITRGTPSDRASATLPESGRGMLHGSTPAATRLVEEYLPSNTPATRLISETPSSNDTPTFTPTGAHRRGSHRTTEGWMRDWRTYAIAGALFIGAGLAVRTLRPTSGDEVSRGGNGADTMTVADAGGLTAAGDSAAAREREDASSLRIGQPSNAGAAKGGKDTDSSTGTTGGARARPPREATPPPARAGGGAGTDRPVDVGANKPGTPIDAGRDERGEHSQPVRIESPKAAETESEAAAVASIRAAIVGAAASLSGRNTSAAESLLDGGVQGQWISLMKEGRISMSLSGSPAVQLRGTRASAEFDASVNVRSPFGANKRRSAHFVAELQRSGGEWRVASIVAVGGLELK